MMQSSENLHRCQGCNGSIEGDHDRIANTIVDHGHIVGYKRYTEKSCEIYCIKCGGADHKNVLAARAAKIVENMIPAHKNNTSVFGDRY